MPNIAAGLLVKEPIESNLDRKLLNNTSTSEDSRVFNSCAQVLAFVSPLIIIAEQITPILSAGAKGNPRQIKRFLNALNLRLQVSNDRGFGNAISAGHLAKLMLAELFLPASVFEHIATSVANAEDGICKKLEILEKAEQPKEEFTTEAGTKKSRVGSEIPTSG